MPSPPPEPPRAPPRKSVLRQLYDGVERRIAPPLEELVRTPQYAELTTALGQAQNLVSGAVQGAAARFWHLVNLPAGTDVQKLRRQVGALDREVRRLRLQLDRTTTTGKDEDADAATIPGEPSGGTGPRAPRGGAERPPGP